MDQVMRFAQAVGDRGRLARGYIHQARLAAARGERGDVLTHARSAVFAAVDAPALVRAYAAVTEARAWAFNGNPEQTLAAVARSRDAFNRANAGVGPRWLLWLDRPELEGQAAWALAMAGLAEPGTQALQTAILGLCVTRCGMVVEDLRLICWLVGDPQRSSPTY